MSTRRTVEASDLGWGWKCEACSYDFTVGDEAYGRTIAPHVVGEWRCARCMRAGAPVIEQRLRSTTRTDATVPFTGRVGIGTYIIRHR